MSKYTNPVIVPVILFITLFFAGCRPSSNKLDLVIKKDPAYPRWLKNHSYNTDQTSGSCFIGLDKKGDKTFLLADDIGKIHHFRIKNDTVFSFSPVFFGEKAEAFLDTFPKQDFEEIVYDKHAGSIYLSIEGNNPDFQKYVGIYRLLFKDNNICADTILGIEKLCFKPEELFLKYTANNIAYEGLAVDNDYFYLGLEGFSESGVFADSTFLFIADKKNLQIIKLINTKQLGIHTICGLYSDKDKSVFGVDRNNKKFFHLNFDNSLNIKDYGLTDIPINIPGYPEYEYVAALESVAMDNDKNIYFVDDPWTTFYMPALQIKEKLDTATVDNFKKFIPIIFKFKLKEPVD